MQRTDHANADTLVALPPGTISSLGELTMVSGPISEPASGPSSAPTTMRMSEAPAKAALPLERKALVTTVAISPMNALPARPIVAPVISPAAPMQYIPSAATPVAAPNAWSAPVLSSSVLQDDPSGPLTYQVFDPSALPAARSGSGSPSRASYPEARSKASLGLRVCLVLLGVCVVVGTAGAIILGASEDPPKAPATATPVVDPAPPAPPAPPEPVVTAEPAPSADVPSPATSPTTGSAKPPASAKPKPAGSAPPALKGARLPPNPFGAPELPDKRK